MYILSITGDGICYESIEKILSTIKVTYELSILFLIII